MFGERWNQILGRQGDSVALWHPDGALTYRDLDRAARALPAQACPQLGRFYLAQGDGPAVAAALLAGLRTGCPVQVVEADRSRRVPVRPPPAGTALVKQTVGSSGLRRCQFFTWAQIAADVDRLYRALRLGECTAALAPLSIAHSFGLTTTVLQTLFNGLPTHWLPTPFPAGLGEALARHERAFLPGVPAMWKAWLLAGIDAGRVHRAVAAGSPLSAELEARVREHFGLQLHNLYGTSETGAISCTGGEAPRAEAGSLGRPLPGVDVRLEADGRLNVSSDAVGLGYDAVEAGEQFGDGHHRTWDRVQFGGAGELIFLGCLGAGINVASRKLSPADIAGKIRAATGVHHVRIHGQPSRDPERVEDVVACVGLPPGQLNAEFKTHACAALAPWEVPRHWRAEEAAAAPGGA